LNSVEVAGTAGYSRGPLHNFFMTRYTEAYVNEINRFVEWLSGADVDVPGGDDGLKALRLADAAVASLASGQTETV
jgi:myo-inositol 2-dehydrogenase/D-chiro-inositol 1-dehydrogenase